MIYIVCDHATALPIVELQPTAIECTNSKPLWFDHMSGLRSLQKDIRGYEHGTITILCQQTSMSLISYNLNVCQLASNISDLTLPYNYRLIHPLRK